MIKLPTFVDLHTHTRYPDNSNFPSQDIERAALNGGYSEILAMAILKYQLIQLKI